MRWIAALLMGLALISQSATAQSPHTTDIRYDSNRRVTGTIAPDPDGPGGNGYPAVRNTYNAAGLLTKVETGVLSSWQSPSIPAASWSGFTVHTITEATYDDHGRKTTETTKGSDLVAVGLVQYSYDFVGRLECTAVRMNPAAYGSLPPSACTLGSEGSFGPDRITKNIYDPAGRLTKIQKAFGVLNLQEDYATYTYSANGKQTSVTDARGYKASMTYDGRDRQIKWNFPSKTTPGTVSATDYEEYGYDANGNRTSLRKRDGSVLIYQYDALNRMKVKTVPDRADLGANHVRDVYYTYDLRGLQTSARYDSITGDGVVSTYDGFGRQTGSTINLYGTVFSLGNEYDRNGNRIRLTHPDGTQFDYVYDGLDRATSIKQGTVTIVGLSYNSRGSRSALSEGVPTSYGYDNIGRLASLAHNLGGGAVTHDVAFTYGYTPASQIASQSRDNDAYVWTGHFNVDRSYLVNGLNQYTAAGPASFCYDANGNLTADGTTVYQYDVENRLVQTRAQVNSDCAALSYAGAQRAALRYDPLGRLYMYGGTVTSPSLRLVYDGDELVAEYSQVTPNPLLRRYIHGPGGDEPLVWYEGTTVATSVLRRLRTDHQGSVIAVADNAGTMIGINRYDEYGIPAASNVGRFQYTGQLWLADMGMYYYKARIYSPTLGRFLQTDPIGYADQVNLYAYVANDPVNHTDPDGLECQPQTGSRVCRTPVEDRDPMWRLYTPPKLEMKIAAAGQESSSGYPEPSALEEALGDLSEEADNAATIAQLGFLGESAVEAKLLEEGYEILGRQVRVQTGLGLRIIDYVVFKPGVTEMTSVEVKVNSSWYGGLQQAKDNVIYGGGGKVAGYLNPSFPHGSLFPSMPTFVARVQCRSVLAC